MPIVERNPVISCDHLFFRYGEEEVVHDISFSVRAGDYIGIVGQNGSGKTTLMRLILGLLKPEKGEVRLFGTLLRDFRDFGKIGYVPQYVFRTEASFPATVREIVESGHVRERTKKPCGTVQHAHCDAVTAALERAGIAHLENRRVGELSGGERQRVFIARALISDPELLVLDEPTTGIDAASEAAFYELLRKLNAEGMTILLVSHDLDVVTREVKTVIFLNRHIVAMGDPKSLATPEVLGKVYGSGKLVLSHPHHLS